MEPRRNKRARHNTCASHASQQIAGRCVGVGEPTWIIAEIGVNHDGDVERAEALISLAAQCGADAVKIQCFHSESLASAGAPLSEYQARRGVEDQRGLLQSLQLPHSCLPRLMAHAQQAGIVLFGSPFDEESLHHLVQLQVPVIKLGSGELTNVPLVRAAARTQRPLILSTGMANWGEIDDAVHRVRQEMDRTPYLLHCVSLYPTPEELANVRAVASLQSRYGDCVGYSDHTTTDEASLAAVTLGAVMLERHLTDDCTREGPDHAASLDAVRFAQWVEKVRRLEATLGDGDKKHRPSEQENRFKVRRGIALETDVQRGEKLTADKLITLRPARGIDARYYDHVVGGIASRDLERGDFLEEWDVEGWSVPGGHETSDPGDELQQATDDVIDDSAIDEEEAADAQRDEVYLGE